MTGRSEIKAALAMVIIEVEASMLKIPAKIVGVGMRSVVVPVRRLLVESMMVSAVNTRVKLGGSM